MCGLYISVCARCLRLLWSSCPVCLSVCGSAAWQSASRISVFLHVSAQNRRFSCSSPCTWLHTAKTCECTQANNSRRNKWLSDLWSASTSLLLWLSFLCSSPTACCKTVELQSSRRRLDPVFSPFTAHRIESKNATQQWVQDTVVLQTSYSA